MEQAIARTFVPKHNRVFFKHFDHAAENVKVMSELLNEALEGSGDHENRPQYAQIAKLRVVSNEIKRAIFADSGRAFISPFERNDMCDLVTAIDTVAGYINISARRFSLYQPVQVSSAMKELVGLIVEMGDCLAKCVKYLTNIKSLGPISDACNQLRTLEHYADKVYNKAVADVLVSETNVIELMKHNEILTALETTTDKAEKVTAVIESIIVKNS